MHWPPTCAQAHGHQASQSCIDRISMSLKFKQVEAQLDVRQDAIAQLQDVVNMAGEIFQAGPSTGAGGP